MSMNLSQLGGSLVPTNAAQSSRDGVSPRSQTAAQSSFGAEIKESLSKVNEELNAAEASARQLAEGKGDLVETMISLGKADLSLRMVVNMRNRALESYQEIMRLQV